MAQIPDPVTVRHPDMPDEVHVVPRRQLPSLERRGWFAAESSADPQVVETPSTEDTDTTSEEEQQ